LSLAQIVGSIEHAALNSPLATLQSASGHSV